MKGLEHVQCKFYNELGRILVRDFTPVQLDELQGEPEDNDFHSTSRQDIGKLEYSFLAGKVGVGGGLGQTAGLFLITLPQPAT